MTMEFIDEREDGIGNIFDVEQVDKKNRHIGESAKSGENIADKVCNIYDLEGNYYEYVAEKDFSNTSFSSILRGGHYHGYYSASSRHDYNQDSIVSRSFRFVLYII